ncbi:MAG: methyltransferase domain-containing protein [Candidatus Lindowbacteria bacterium]|nr:methyltransferase domain-containing protein [Candidatus Lindowbacteria bacterium]
MSETTKDYAAQYWESEEYRESRANRAGIIWNLIEEELSQAQAPILDIGCGPGLLKVALAELSGRRIWGIEVDPSVAVTSEDMIFGNGLKLPIKSNSVGFVLLNHIIEHLEQPEQLIAEVARVLRPGGIAYVTTPNYNWPWEVHYRVVGIHWLPKDIADVVVRAMKRGQAFDNVRLLQYHHLIEMAKRERLVPTNLLPRLFMERPEILRKAYWKMGAKVLRFVPKTLRNTFFTQCSPQFMILLRKV